MREYWRAANLLNPLPVVLVTCVDENGKANVMTAAWVGTICSDPVMVSVSLRKSRYSHDLIVKSKELVINLTNEELVAFVDYAGIYSGKKVDKLQGLGKYKVTSIPSSTVKAPTIAESPVALECKVKEILELGSHDMFICEVLKTSVDEKVLDEHKRLDLKKAKLITYCHGEYYSLGKKLGSFAYTSKKKERSRRTDLHNQNKDKKRKKS